jgi:hypothetical protein
VRIVSIEFTPGDEEEAKEYNGKERNAGEARDVPPRRRLAPARTLKRRRKKEKAKTK